MSIFKYVSKCLLIQSYKICDFLDNKVFAMPGLMRYRHAFYAFSNFFNLKKLYALIESIVVVSSKN